MARVIKKQGKKTKAWALGARSEMEKKLIAEGKIVVKDDGSYELFSQEANSGSGEVAQAGDYFKVDNAGYPYPNGKDWFEANHKHIEGEDYEQLPKELEAWEISEVISPVMMFLLQSGKLKIDFSNEKEFFGAELWGSWLTAAKDAVIVFYGVTKDEAGNITDADFNFVARSEFEQTYSYC